MEALVINLTVSSVPRGRMGSRHKSADIVSELLTKGTYKRGFTVRNKEESEENVTCYCDYNNQLDVSSLFRGR